MLKLEGFAQVHIYVDEAAEFYVNLSGLLMEST